MILADASGGDVSGATSTDQLSDDTGFPESRSVAAYKPLNLSFHSLATSELNKAKASISCFAASSACKRICLLLC